MYVDRVAAGTMSRTRSRHRDQSVGFVGSDCLPQYWSLAVEIEHQELEQHGCSCKRQSPVRLQDRIMLKPFIRR